MKVTKNAVKSGLSKIKIKPGGDKKTGKNGVNNKTKKEKSGRVVGSESVVTAAAVVSGSRLGCVTGDQCPDQDLATVATQYHRSVVTNKGNTATGHKTTDAKSSKSLKRKSDQHGQSSSASAKSDANVKKAKKQGKKDSSGTIKSTEVEKGKKTVKPVKKGATESGKAMASKKSTSKPKLSKSNPKDKKKQLLKVSKNIFTSKCKNRALINTGKPKKSTERSSGSNEKSITSSQDNKKAESKSVKNAKKPKTGSSDNSDKLKLADSEAKVKKRKLDKKTLAKRKLNRMKKLGYLTAPPRRSAALNASAIMNCIFDKQTSSASGVAPSSGSGIVSKQIEIKDELPDSDDDTATMNNSNVEESDSRKRENEEIVDKKQQTPKMKTKKVIKTKSRDTERSLSESFGGIGSRRMASLNASAMMSASFGKEERRARRDPLTIAIEASLKDMKDLKAKQTKDDSFGEVSPIAKPKVAKTVCENIRSSTPKNVKSYSPKKRQEKKENTSVIPEIEVKKEVIPSSFRSSIEGLSETDIKMKLIESAKIKSKISRLSTDGEKSKKKLKKVTKVDACDDKILTKKAESNCDKIQTKDKVVDNMKAIKFELVPGVEKTSKLETLPSARDGKESSCKTEIKPMLEITRQQSVVTSQQKQPIKQVKPEVSSAVITPGTLKMEMSKETSAGSGSSSRMSSVTATSGRGSSMVHPVQASVTNKPDINSLVYSQGPFPPMLKVQQSSTPTATVQPTMLSLGQTSVKSVVGRPQFPTYPHQYHQQQQPHQYQYHQSSSSSGQFVQYPTFPPTYSQNYPGHGQTPGQYQSFQSGKNTTRGPQHYAGSSSTFSQQGYFIAPPFVPVTSVGVTPSSVSSGSVSQQTGSGGAGGAASGFICGPYNYPYGAGRMIGPIIAIAPGSIPVAGGPIINIPTSSSSNQSLPQQPTIINTTDTADIKPHGKAMPIMSSSIPDPSLFRQILPKNNEGKQLSSGPSQSSSGMGHIRPMQIVGPIAASNNPGLVATVLPNMVQNVSMSSGANTIMTTTTSTTTSITKIVTGVKKTGTVKNNLIETPSPSSVIVNHVMIPQQPVDTLKTFHGDRFSKSALKLENTVKEIHIKNNLSKTPTCRASNTSISRSGSTSEILNIPSQIRNQGDVKTLSDSLPLVTVTVKTKTSGAGGPGGESKEQHLLKRPKDWKEAVKEQNILQKSKSKSCSTLVTPLRVPKPNFQFLDKDSVKLQNNKLSVKSVGGATSDTMLPTFHINPTPEPPSSPLQNTGHPGLPSGLLRTTSLMHNSKSPTKMTLKEMKRIPSKVLVQPMSIITPVSKIENETKDLISDKPPKLSPQVSLSKSEFRAPSPSLNRSRLQLKPATSPKLTIEQYLTVSTDDVSKLVSKSSQSSLKTRRGLTVSGLEADKTSSAIEDLQFKRAASVEPVSPQPSLEKKPKRESLSKRKSSSSTILIPWSKRNKEPPKKSGGWSWKGESFVGKVYLNNEELPVERICYNSMRHEEGDEEVSVKDCILLASGNRKKDLPFIAKVTSLWENPEDGEMMMSLLWFYRPEHTDIGRQPGDCDDEVFASKHRDFTSVACIEDKCFVMTFNEYCRYMRFSRMLDEGVTPPWNIVPERKDDYPRAELLPKCQVAHDRVFLCRKVYDPRGRRMYKNPY